MTTDDFAEPKVYEPLGTGEPIPRAGSGLSSILDGTA
jgi:hypothetical protein